MSRKPTLDPKDLSDDGTEVRRVAADHDAAREALSEETNRDDRVRLSKDEEETVLRAYKESKEKAEGHRVFKQFRDVKFKPGSTAFDRHNPERTGSFHGFFALFWLGLAFLAVKTVLQHWRRTGHFFRGELATMYRFNLLDLATADAVMVSSSVFVVLLQMAIFHLGLSWNKVGWLIENTWQASYLAIVVRLSYSRDWQWIQCVVIVLHCCVMLMKQHSYATYMGYLSEVHKAKGKLERKLVSLRETEGQETAAKTTRVVGPSSEEEEEANILGEIGQLSDELTHDGVTYPENLTFANYVDYLLVPSLVYDIVYPRTERIRWWFVLEKTLATLGTFALMTMIVEHYILPVIPADLATMTTNQKFEQLPWLMLDMVFPFITMYLLTFYIIFECVCQWFAEITRFADRNFYNDWWNSLTWVCPLSLSGDLLAWSLMMVGRLCARLERAGTQVPPPTRLPQLHVRPQRQEEPGLPHHFLPLERGARDGDGLHDKEDSTLPPLQSDAATAPRRPHAATDLQEEPRRGKRLFLVRTLLRALLSLSRLCPLLIRPDLT